MAVEYKTVYESRLRWECQGDGNTLAVYDSYMYEVPCLNMSPCRLMLLDPVVMRKFTSYALHYARYDRKIEQAKKKRAEKTNHSVAVVALSRTNRALVHGRPTSTLDDLDMPSWVLHRLLRKDSRHYGQVVRVFDPWVDQYLQAFGRGSRRLPSYKKLGIDEERPDIQAALVQAYDCLMLCWVDLETTLIVLVPVRQTPDIWVS